MRTSKAAQQETNTMKARSMHKSHLQHTLLKRHPMKHLHVDHALQTTLCLPDAFEPIMNASQALHVIKGWLTLCSRAGAFDLSTGLPRQSNRAARLRQRPPPWPWSSCFQGKFAVRRRRRGADVTRRCIAILHHLCGPPLWRQPGRAAAMPSRTASYFSRLASGALRGLTGL